MANGKPGDHPLTDLLHYGNSKLPPDLQQIVREIVEADPRAFHTPEVLNERMLGWQGSDAAWFDWEQGKRLDEARDFLTRLLELSRVIRDERDPVADATSAALVAEFPSFDQARREVAMTFPLHCANPQMAGVRINFDMFLIYGDVIRERLIIETYPMPSVRWNGNVIYRFVPGDSNGLVAFLKGLESGKYVIAEVVRGMFSAGASVHAADSVPKLGFAKLVRHRVKFVP